MDDRREIFRDHFKECLDHFAKRFNAKVPPGKKGFELRKLIANFCGVGDPTVQRWLSDFKDHLPVGEIEVKLKCFLDLNGYRVIELERLPRVVRNFVELIGFDLLSTNAAAELLGYVRVYSLYPVLRGDEEYGGISKDKETKMFDVWKGKKEELEQKKREALKLYCFDFLNQTGPVPSQQLLLPPAIIGGTMASRRTAVLTILKGTLVLLEEGLFSELSER